MTMSFQVVVELNGKLELSVDASATYVSAAYNHVSYANEYL